MTEPTTANPGSVPELSPRDRYIIAARVEGYINNHQAAVDLLTEALELHPGDARLLRFRGHRRISIRDYAGAIADLEAAAAQIDQVDDEFELYQRDVEPEAMRLIVGKPPLYAHHPRVADVVGTPVAERYMTNLHTSIWYHLGVAQYLSGRFEEARDSFAKAYATALHYEGKVASLDWQYMILNRLGRPDEATGLLDEFAALADEWDEAGIGYDDRMRLYSGELSPDDLRARISDNTMLLATIGYGLGNWYLYNGQPDVATEVFRDVLGTGAKYAFAYMAAEADLAGELPRP